MGFTEETRVLTNLGLRKAGDLAGTSFSVVVDGRVVASGFKRTLMAPVWEVRLENGVRVSAGGGAWLMTFDGWKRVDELKAGHDSVLLASAACFKWNGRGTEDDGYVAGFLWANRSSYGFSVLVSNDTDADEFEPIRRVREYYYKKRKRHKDFVLTGHDLCYRRHTIASRLFREVSKEYGLFDAEGRARLCEDGSHAFTMGELKGAFDAVGIIMHNAGEEKTTTVRLRSDDEGELRAAQRLLIVATGITPRIEGDELVIEGDEDMSAFQQKIGFLNNEKRKLLSCFRPRPVLPKNYRYAKVASATEKEGTEARGCKGTNCACFYADGVLARA